MSAKVERSVVILLGSSLIQLVLVAIVLVWASMHFSTTPSDIYIRMEALDTNLIKRDRKIEANLSQVQDSISNISIWMKQIEGEVAKSSAELDKRGIWIEDTKEWIKKREEEK